MSSAADLSANELAWAALDKPLFANNALYNISNGAKWVVGSINGTTGSTEGEDTDFPTENLFDRFPSNLSKPNAASTNFSIVLDRSTAPVTFDFLAVLNHNLDSLSCTAFNLQIADNGTFTTNLATLSSINVGATLSSDRRFTDLNLNTGGGTARRYSDVPYIRLQIQCTSGIPQIGQIILGRRRQQQYQPELQWDPANEISEMDDYVSRSGVINRLSRYKAKRRISARFRHSTDAEQTDVLEWWTDIEGGEQPFFYIDEPTTLPNDFWMMFMDPPELIYPYTLFNTRDLELNGVEQGAALFSLE